MNSSKIGGSVKTYGSGPGQPNLDSNYNNETMISLTTKYNILEENLNQLLRAMDEHKKDFLGKCHRHLRVQRQGVCHIHFRRPLRTDGKRNF